MKEKVIATLLYVILVLGGCELVWISPDPQPTPEVVFEHLWRDLNERYAYFDHKGVDWGELYSVFRPQISSDMDDQKLFEVLGEMLHELKDGHVNLSSDFNRSRNWEWYQQFPMNYNENVILLTYLKNDHWISGSLYHQMHGEVLYINYRSFAQEISEADLNAIMERAAGTKGVILDIRSNGGGNLANAYRLAGCFTDSRTRFAEQRWKNGPRQDDFTPWSPMFVVPRNGLRYAGKVVVLTNRRAYSASTFFAQMMRSLPGVQLLGDQTGGGGGTPAFGELPNGWIYRFSATQTIDLEGRHLEDGVPVDLEVRLRRTDENAGRDTLIE
ncbi:MAG: S41 family peptidase [Lunatimonas sp.]|nr:S41 family peptidase [Lunatimonas sp.]